MLRAVLMRGGKMFEVINLTDGEAMVPYYSRRHREELTVGGAYGKEDTEPPAMLTSYVEHFRRANYQCPLCNCVVFNSENYMSLPEHILRRTEY